MFNNIGGKIKGVAEGVCWIGIVVSVIIGLIAIQEGGIFILVLGPLVSWLSSLMYYGFGQLIENTQVIREKMEGADTGNNQVADSISEVDRKMNTLNKWKAEGVISEEDYQQQIEKLRRK